MKDPLFSGVCTALVTPFIGDTVNYPLLEQLLRKQLDAGIKAIVLCGTTGEAPVLTDEEKEEIIQRSKAYVDNRCKIIAGTGTNDTAHAILLSKQAEACGADGLLVVAPYYNKGNAEGLFSHYMSIASAVNIPIILYNVPSRTGVDLPVSLYKKLAVHPNIIGVKEATCDITKFTKIHATCPSDFYVWSGNDDMTVPAIALGGIGVISVLSNLCPEDMIAMTDAALDGDMDTASVMQLGLSHLNELMFSETNPIPVKYAMRYAGFDCGKCRLPLGQLSDENKKRIDQYFR